GESVCAAARVSCMQSTLGCDSLQVKKSPQVQYSTHKIPDQHKRPKSGEDNDDEADWNSEDRVMIDGSGDVANDASD
ncbi:hypothetical protein BaRGS_00018699, partial [Batillaria attramentaria]